jgi:2',3'-cyclic-nucleotide 2'-phosphodiesterase (5'-nucleotidase family)
MSGSATRLCLLAIGLGAARREGRAADLLFHADLNGELAIASCGGAGRPAPGKADLARVAGLVQSLRKTKSTDDPAVLLLGGNIAAPGLFGRFLLESEGTSAQSGRDLLGELLARTGYGAVTFGHHDLSLPVADRDGLAAAIARHGMPVVITNLRCADRRRPICSVISHSAVLERGSERIGILAALSPLALPGLSPASQEGLELEPAIPAVLRAAARLRRQGVDYIVVMAQGPHRPEWILELLAWQDELSARPGGEGVDLVLAGGVGGNVGGQLRLIERDQGPTIIGGADGIGGMVRVQSDAHPRVQVLPVTGETPSDPGIEARLQPALAAYCARFGQAIGGPRPVRLRRPIGRDDFLRYLLSVMRLRARAEIALVNRDFVKNAPFPMAGIMTRADLLRAMPYAEILGRARVTGTALATAIAPALSNPRLAALGLERAPDGSLTVNGRPLDRARHYTVASHSFLAAGGDRILASDILHLQVGPDATQLRTLVEQALAGDAAARDGDPTVDPNTDFGPPASARPLLVTLADLSLDFGSVAVWPQPGYQAPQLTRAEQRAFKGDLTALTQLRTSRHEADARFKMLYGLSRTSPPGAPASTGETGDLLALSTLYNFRGLRTAAGPGASPRLLPDPYARLLLESELTVPTPRTPEDRHYRHAELTATVGALVSLTPGLRVRGGPGVRRQLLAAGPAGQSRFLVEGGATLEPTVLGTFGPFQTRLEALLDYSFVEPTTIAEHQVRASARLAFPLLPLLYLTTGLDVFGMKRATATWGLATDVTVGVRLHVDAAHQRL